MASKYRNVFYKNKNQETTEVGTCNLPPICDCMSCRPSDIRPRVDSPTFAWMLDCAGVEIHLRLSPPESGPSNPLGLAEPHFAVSRGKCTPRTRKASNGVAGLKA
ncbi:hypothetical protein AAG570_008995 [Ranatra chinensis]|uniref:Uncharacterized protein n=1 Tax=Ranatra chinensis TaxID=642074 RepID=A0ABD0YSG8_9HEMI